MTFELENNLGEHQGYFRTRQSAEARSEHLKLRNAKIRAFSQDDEFPLGTCEDDSPGDED